jgi:hypothetical protein
LRLNWSISAMASSLGSRAPGAAFYAPEVRNVFGCYGPVVGPGAKTPLGWVEDCHYDDTAPNVRRI